ncbi:hypothetical protein PO124_08345 [Bacillus licheniformis]|nr:hypothetical protein [Bacillus licheniformis]
MNVYLSQEAPVDEWEDVVGHPVADKRISIVPVLLITLRLKKDYANSPWL